MREIFLFYMQIPAIFVAQTFQILINFTYYVLENGITVMNCHQLMICFYSYTNFFKIKMIFIEVFNFNFNFIFSFKQHISDIKIFENWNIGI